MKKLVVILVALMFSLVLATPVFAYGQVTGTCIDNVTLQGWQHGGSVEVIGWPSYETYGADFLASDGSFSIPLSDPDPVPDPADAFLIITINYFPGPNGQPPQGQVIRLNVAGSATLDLGGIMTGAGPTAITLTDVSASAANPWLPVGLTAVALAFAAVALVIHRKR